MIKYEYSSQLKPQTASGSANTTQFHHRGKSLQMQGQVSYISAGQNHNSQRLRGLYNLSTDPAMWLKKS